MIERRNPQYARNPALERLLEELNELLAPVEARLAAGVDGPRLPTLLVVGGPRTGSTLLMQWLASTGAFGYPTNLVSRFYGAPAVGAKIQLLLTSPKYAFKDQLADLVGQPSFESDLGKTRGVLAPNDFWHFWRRFTPNQEPRFLSDAELASVDGCGFAAELGALEAVLELPLALKATFLQLHIPWLARVLPNAIFLNLTRDPLLNAQSLLEARQKFFGGREHWYGLKPREYEELRHRDPIEQVCGQVYFKNLAVKEGLAVLLAERQLSVDYEDFCQRPAALFEALKHKLQEAGYDTSGFRYAGPARFESSRTVRLSTEEVEAVRAAFAALAR